MCFLLFCFQIFGHLWGLNQWIDIPPLKVKARDSALNCAIRHWACTERKELTRWDKALRKYQPITYCTCIMQISQTKRKTWSKYNKEISSWKSGLATKMIQNVHAHGTPFASTKQPKALQHCIHWFPRIKECNQVFVYSKGLRRDVLQQLVVHILCTSTGDLVGSEQMFLCVVDIVPRWA